MLARVEKSPDMKSRDATCEGAFGGIYHCNADPRRSSTMPVTRIPIIDLAGVRAGDPLALQRVAKEIHEACTTIGFFYIVNHGVPQAAVNHRHRGFNALGDATMYQAKRPDYKEFFSIGLELPEDDPDVLAGQALRGPNNWPDFMP